MTPSPDNMSQYFGKDLEAMSFAKNYHKWILAEFLPYIGRSVAEVGAGTGNFSKLLLDTPIERLTAFEPSQNMFPLLAESLSHDKRATAINGYFGDEDTGEDYDSVLYVNVLEHIEDDASEFANAHKSLKLQGHLLVFVPALPWLYSPFDKQVGHYLRYLKKDIVNLAQGAGFTIVKARYFDIAGILPWYVNFVLLKHSMQGGGVSAYDRLIVPPMRFVESLIPPPIGKNVLLVAEKNELYHPFEKF